MSSEFIHLRVHSDFSMMDGLNKVKPLLDECVKQEMPAMAPSSIAFADLLLTMILSKTAPWETAMMEKMDAIKALNAQT